MEVLRKVIRLSIGVIIPIAGVISIVNGVIIILVSYGSSSFRPFFEFKLPPINLTDFADTDPVLLNRTIFGILCILVGLICVAGGLRLFFGTLKLVDNLHYHKKKRTIHSPFMDRINDYFSWDTGEGVTLPPKREVPVSTELIPTFDSVKPKSSSLPANKPTIKPEAAPKPHQAKPLPAAAREPSKPTAPKPVTVKPEKSLPPAPKPQVVNNKTEKAPGFFASFSKKLKSIVPAKPDRQPADLPKKTSPVTATPLEPKAQRLDFLEQGKEAHAKSDPKPEVPSPKHHPAQSEPTSKPAIPPQLVKDSQVVEKAEHKEAQANPTDKIATGSKPQQSKHSPEQLVKKSEAIEPNSSTPTVKQNSEPASQSKEKEPNNRQQSVSSEESQYRSMFQVPAENAIQATNDDTPEPKPDEKPLKTDISPFPERKPVKPLTKGNKITETYNKLFPKLDRRDPNWLDKYIDF